MSLCTKRAASALASLALSTVCFSQTEFGVRRNAQSFQAVNTNDILVLGIGGNLWLEHAPFGAVPPARRQQVDANVPGLSGREHQ